MGDSKRFLQVIRNRLFVEKLMIEKKEEWDFSINDNCFMQFEE